MNRRLRLVFVVLIFAGCFKGRQSQVQPASAAGKKNIVVLTPAAAKKLHELFQQSDAKYLSASVSDEFGYRLELALEMDPTNVYLGESLGISIIVDRKSALLFPPNIVVDLAEQSDGGFAFEFVHPPEEVRPDTSLSLVEARRGFKTTLARQESSGESLPIPPPEVFQVVRFNAAPGQLSAYLTVDPYDGKRHPAIIWITGGDCNTIGDVWTQDPPDNDQTAAAFRQAGIVMMFPSLRGGNDNPGYKEGFFGEVDDVVAAAEFLAKQPFVDANRIYLGGHSSGGTLALLTAECSDRFRAVFAFGPTDSVRGYPPHLLPFAKSDPKEFQLRAPGLWLHSIQMPVFVIEGSDGTVRQLHAMAQTSTNPRVQFFAVNGTDHFGVLAPTNRLIAERILQDTGPTCNLAFTLEEIEKPFHAGPLRADRR